MLASTRHHCVDFIELGAATGDDLARAKMFYQSTFGWKYKEWGDEYVDTQDSGVGTGINADASHRPKQPLVVIYTDDLAATHEKVTGSGGTLTKPLFSFPGGRRFHFKDPAGNELAVWSDK